MAYYLGFRGLFDDLLAVTTTSLQAARRLGDRAAEGEALTNLGLALYGLRRFDEAVIAHQDAAAIFREPVTGTPKAMPSTTSASPCTAWTGTTRPSSRTRTPPPSSANR